MAFEVPSFLKRDGGSLLYNGKEDEFLFYIPENFFECGIAEINGDYISTIGLMNYTEESNGKNNGLKTFSFPTMFLTRPYMTEKLKQVRLLSNQDPTDYRVLRYKKGDQIVVQTKVPKLIDNVEMFYQLFIVTGKIPNTIPYSILQDYILESIDLNGSDYKLNNQLFGVVISELIRDPNDPRTPYRLSKHLLEDTGYRVISIKEVPKYISPFTAVTSENWDESIMAGIMNENPKDSPLERVLML